MKISEYPQGSIYRYLGHDSENRVVREAFPSHAHIGQYLTEAEIIALPGFGGGGGSSPMATTTYTGNGAFPREIVFEGNFTFWAGVALGTGGTPILCFFGGVWGWTPPGGFVTNYKVISGVGKFVIESSNSVLNVNGIVYKLLVWGVAV